MNTLQRWLLQERTEGQAAGRIEVLQRLLTRRFGPLRPDVAQRLAALSPAQLDRCCDRVLDAASLDDVFADDRP